MGIKGLENNRLGTLEYNLGIRYLMNNMMMKYKWHISTGSLQYVHSFPASTEDLPVIFPVQGMNGQVYRYKSGNNSKPGREWETRCRSPSQSKSRGRITPN